MIEVKLDEKEVRTLCLEKIEEHIKKVDSEMLFWDTKELVKRTCMSLSTIQREFFYEPDFPKRKVGGKWYFPVQQTKDFLLKWIEKH
ncbi:group-specific protein [Rossellomorea marisflavi]|uniref:group-specific protein n=1 Tax=Rossellomorea marisflavi TaxID=189381 RepID=UPI00345D7E51